MNGDPAPVWLCAVIAGVLGGLNGLGRLFSLFPRLQFADLRRWHPITYVSVSAVIAASVLLVLHHLSEPAGRLAAAEQVLLAALGSVALVRPGPTAQAAAASTANDHQDNTGAPLLGRTGALFDSLLAALARELRTEMEACTIAKVRDCHWIEYRKARNLFRDSLIDIVTGRSEQDRAEFIAKTADLEDKALEDLAAARDELIRLTLAVGGEKILEELLGSYAHANPRSRPSTQPSAAKRRGLRRKRS